VEIAITLPVLHVRTFPARERPLQRCKAPGARNGLAGARVAAARAAGGSASRRNKLASSPHRLMRGALKVALLFAAAVSFSAVMAVSADMPHRHFHTIALFGPRQRDTQIPDSEFPIFQAAPSWVQVRGPP